MPNQMIALQAKGPKLPDPANQTAKFVNMMNMTKQQEVAERQSAQAAQQMAYATAEEDRKKQMFPSTLAKGQSEAESAELDRNAKAAANLKTDLAVITSGDVNAISAWRENAVKMLPAWGQYLPPAEKIAQDRNVQLTIAMTIQQIADKTIMTPTSTMEITGATGPLPPNTAVEVKLGGLDGPSITPIKVAGAAQPPTAVPQAPAAAPAPNAMAPAAAAPAGAPMRATQGANTTPRDLMQQGMDPRNIPSGMPTSPISFTPGSMGTPTAGQMTPDMVPAILDSAVNTGVMAQIDLDQMLALAPPQARQGIMDVIRSNKIALQADAPSLAASAMSQQQPMGANPVQTPQSQFADMRGPAPQSQTAGLRGAPPMEQTLAQYQSILRKDPNVAPTPGVYNVPTSQVAEKARAERESPAEAAAKARAVAAVNAETETAKKAAERLPGRKQVDTLVKKVRNAYEALEKENAIVSEKRGGFANAMDYFATSSLGREAQKMVGTKTSKYLSEITNSRKLLATAIKNATGMSAQEMNSNTELQLMLDALTDPTQGIEAARSTLDTLQELYGVPGTAVTAVAPRAAAKTPVIPTLTPEQVRANPNIKRWKRADNGQIMVRK